MKLSVVIPARNATEHLEVLFAALLPQLSQEDECIVVDDASEDTTAQIAQRHGATVFATDRRSGPAAARNLGVSHAAGDLLVFLDSDVVPHPGLLDRMRTLMQKSPEIDALFGSYDATPFVPTTVSRFRNLLHCYTHHNASRVAATFWAGCGAMRRAAFEKAGGFDAQRYPDPSIEDVELGLRMTRAGARISLDPTLQVQHRKAWTLVGMLRTDLLQRAVPWTLLILESGKMPLDLNLKMSQRVSGMATAGACLTTGLLPFVPLAAAPATVLLLATVIALNAHFYRFLQQCGGTWFAVRSIPLHWLYFLCSVAGFAVGWSRFNWRSLQTKGR